MPDHETAALQTHDPPLAAQTAERPPPRHIAVLLPVWGYEYTQQFLRATLPTLMAPGNLPALAQALPTRFMFLTSAKDRDLIQATAQFRRLGEICAVEFLVIDDLITEANHSTTITLAFARAVRLAGAAMVDTCFFFLVSDYIVADGSFGSVLTRMMAGASAVQCGNFQIVEDDAARWLDRALERAGECLSLSPRELMRHALTCMHPTTIANTVNVAISHHTGANRLFWRVDGNTLIARCYLMHMICVRPEVADFVIGASCDYSFVPEMCPSGDIAVITDSDEYLVVEAQPRGHEANFLALGPVTTPELAASLSEWTTAGHRANVGSTLIFHAGDIPRNIGTAIAEADAFVAEVAGRLQPQPQPHRDHPYWRGAIAAHQGQIGERSDADWILLLGQPVRRSSRLLPRLRDAILGRPPKLRPWHPRAADYRRPVSELNRMLAVPETALLVVSGSPTPLTTWLEATGARRVSLTRLLRPDFSLADAAAPGLFDGCYVELAREDLARGHLIIERVAAMLQPGAEILVVAFNRNWASGADQLAHDFARSGQDLLQRLDVSLEDLWLVGSSRWRWSANRALLGSALQWHAKSAWRRPLHLVCVGIQAMLAFGANLVAVWRHREGRPYREGRILSSVFLRLRVADEGAPVTLSSAMVALEPLGVR